MKDEMTIEKMIKLLQLMANRLESYITDGIPVYYPNLIVGEDYRVDSAETRIDDYKRKIDKDKKMIKSIKKFAQRRKELTRANSKKKSKK